MWYLSTSLMVFLYRCCPVEWASLSLSFLLPSHYPTQWADDSCKEPWEHLILKIPDFSHLSTSYVVIWFCHTMCFFVTLLSHARHILVLDALKIVTTSSYFVMYSLPMSSWLFSNLTFSICLRTSYISIHRPWLTDPDNPLSDLFRFTLPFPAKIVLSN